MISVGKSGCHSQSYYYSWSIWNNRMSPPPILTPHPSVGHLLTSSNHILHIEGNICTCLICQDAFLLSLYNPWEIEFNCKKIFAIWNKWYLYQKVKHVISSSMPSMKLLAHSPALVSSLLSTSFMRSVKY